MLSDRNHSLSMSSFLLTIILQSCWLLGRTHRQMHRYTYNMHSCAGVSHVCARVHLLMCAFSSITPFATCDFNWWFLEVSLWNSMQYMLTCLSYIGPGLSVTIHKGKSFEMSTGLLQWVISLGKGHINYFIPQEPMLTSFTLNIILYLYNIDMYTLIGSHKWLCMHAKRSRRVNPWHAYSLRQFHVRTYNLTT